MDKKNTKAELLAYIRFLERQNEDLIHILADANTVLVQVTSKEKKDGRNA